MFIRRNHAMGILLYYMHIIGFTVNAYITRQTFSPVPWKGVHI